MNAWLVDLHSAQGLGSNYQRANLGRVHKESLKKNAPIILAKIVCNNSKAAGRIFLKHNI
jgi:hypothetical protein